MNVKDLCGGVLMLVSGAAVIYGAQGYGIGSMTQMGAGYFPTLLGGLLVIVGVAMVWGARRAGALDTMPAMALTGKPEVAAKAPAGIESTHTRVEWRGGACILLSIVAFVLFGKWFGLLPASFAIVFISALGDRRNTVWSALLIGTCLALICVVVFWWALKIQMPLFHLP
jgi:hypothetical protein